MLFNSYEFLFVFLPLTLWGYYWLAQKEQQYAALWLFLASLIFYGWASPFDLLILSGSILINFEISKQMAKHFGAHSQVARLWMVAGVTINLLLLGYFKYRGFLVENINVALGLNWRVSAVVLPLGISFFSFTQIAYLVDTFRYRLPPPNFVHYGLFVTYFPHLVAGPILHHRQMLPQFSSQSMYQFVPRNMALGLTIFILGLSKKLLLADPMAEIADPVFNHSLNHSVVESWLGAFAYTLQIYFDFSGYSDMAVGLARMLGGKIPINFDSPYKAKSIVDFWRRWHISLSQFLRDYLYIPLGGNRRGELGRYANLLTTMLIGGLWHGASWNFVIWGGLHGSYLTVNHLMIQSKIKWRGLSWAAWPITILAVVIAWVFFRAKTLSEATRVLAAMFGSADTVTKVQFSNWLLALMAGAAVIAVALPNTQQLARRWKLNWWYALFVGALALACLIKMKTIAGPEFIYYNF